MEHQKKYNTYIRVSSEGLTLNVNVCLTLYDTGGGGALKAPPTIFCSHAFNFVAALLCVGDFSQKIV